MPSIITDNTNNNNNNKYSDDDNDDDDGLDAWDKKYGAGRKTFRFGGGEQEEDQEHGKIPNWEHVKKKGAGGGGLIPGFFAVEVSQLPRHALVEWSSLGLRHSHITLSSSSSSSSYSSYSSSCSIPLPPSPQSKTTATRSFHYIPIPLSSSSTRSEIDIDSEIAIFLYTIYGDKEIIDSSSSSSSSSSGSRTKRSQEVETTVYTSSPKDLRHGKGGLVVPVIGVYGEEGEKLAAGVVLSLWTTESVY